MRIAISNIAWDANEDAAVAALLSEAGLDAIDIAPSKYFPNPPAATDADIMRVGREWKGRGIAVTGMQALTFGTSGLNLFADNAVQQRMLDHLTAVLRIGAGLGARHAVFGSPAARDRKGLDDEATLAIAADFFGRLGDIAADLGVVVCLEPNPVAYGANFMTTTDETAMVVRHVNHPFIRMQLDTGAVTMNGEDIDGLLERHAGLIGHIHASEPQLATLGSGSTNHAAMGRAVSRYCADRVVAIEMRASTDVPHLAAIERAVRVAMRHYGNGRMGNTP